MIAVADVMGLVGRWWHEYDEGNFDAWPALLADDVHFTCRTDTGATAFEEFVRADLRGRDHVVRWQTEHRMGSPYPLRHNAANIHLTEPGEQSARFASYIFVTHIVAGAVTPVSTARVEGAVSVEEGELRISELHVVLDTQTSVVFSER